MTVHQPAIDACKFYLSQPDPISRQAAVAIVSCLYYESALKPGSQGIQSTETPGVLNPSGAYGIASWNGPRQAALAAFASAKGLDVAAVNTQLLFVLTEMANNYHKVWAAITNPNLTYEQIIPIFVADYENPADHAKEIAAALAIAVELIQVVPEVVISSPVVMYPPAVTSPVKPTPIPSKADAELSLIELVLNELETMPQVAQSRILIYLTSRLGK